jgi:hypothetical protein
MPTRQLVSVMGQSFDVRPSLEQTSWRVMGISPSTSVPYAVLLLTGPRGQKQPLQLDCEQALELAGALVDEVRRVQRVQRCRAGEVA